jgi:hypothetical protein
MKTITYLIIPLLSGVLISFTNPVNSGLDVTFGVTSSDPSRIELSLNEDFSYTYHDFSNPRNQVSVSGTYERDGNTIYLLSEENDFHQKWKIKEDGAVATSRLGLCFYRLRKLSD